MHFYRFLPFLGSSIEPEKASAKSASTPYPPQKVNFMGYLLKLGSELLTAPFLTIFNCRRKQFFF
jgi:hypothetical protein